MFMKTSPSMTPLFPQGSILPLYWKSPFLGSSTQKLYLDVCLSSIDLAPTVYKKSQNPFTETYTTSHQIGKGAFGKIFKVSPIDDRKLPFAAKVVPLSESDLQKEAVILQSLVSEPGFPRLLDYFTEANHGILVMSLLGPNLGCLQKRCQGRKLENKGIDLQARKIMNEGLKIYMKNADGEGFDSFLDF